MTLPQEQIIAILTNRIEGIYLQSNFSFLEQKWPLLASVGALAERYIYTDSNSCFIKLGLFAESLVRLVFTLDGIEEPQQDNTHANRIRILKHEGLLPKDIDDILYALRSARNKAAHMNFESVEEAALLLEFAYKLGVWFMQTYGDWQYEPAAFVMPSDTSKE
jgi:type I restriction enzyme R subunit